MKKLFLAIAIFTGSCTIAPRVSVSNVANNANANLVTDGKLFATAFQQKAAEYRALCLQAFNIAHLRVDEIVLTKTEKPKAIITDIDETILDNSRYEAHQLLHGKDYEPATWLQWTAMADADTVPGAASFLKYASARGLEIFYISNREEKERHGTLKNLKKFNLPNADDAHIFLRQNTSSKEERRKIVEANHSVVMLLGDNLGDFSFLFDKKTAAERMNNVNVTAMDYGNSFIILPNPVYGGWEAAMYNDNYTLTPAQKDSCIKATLKGY